MTEPIIVRYARALADAGIYCSTGYNAISPQQRWLDQQTDMSDEYLMDQALMHEDVYAEALELYRQVCAYRSVYLSYGGVRLEFEVDPVRFVR